MTYFIELLNEFTHVSNIIKHGNHKIFLDDLEIQLENMQKKLQEKLGLDVPISKIIENPAEYLQSHLEELNDENQLPTGDETNQKVDDASSEKESDAGTPYRYPEEDEGSPPGDHKFLSVDNFDFSRSPQAPLEENDENRNSANFERIEEGDDDEFHSFGDNQNPNSNKELHSKKYLCELVFSLRQIHEYLQEARKIVNSHTLGNNTAICNLVSILSNSPDLKVSFFKLSLSAFFLFFPPFLLLPPPSSAFSSSSPFLSTFLSPLLSPFSLIPYLVFLVSLPSYLAFLHCNDCSLLFFLLLVSPCFQLFFCYLQ